MSGTFIRKLETYLPLSEDDRYFIHSVPRRVDAVASDADIIREGDKPTDVRLVETGFACRYKLLDNGQRRIVGFLFPGDICVLHTSFLGHMDHGIATVSASKIVRLKQSDVEALFSRPAIARALLMVTLVNESIVRDWLANIGGRRAEQRVAHLLCEWHTRLRLVGLTEEDGCEFPLTQTQIGEALGLTSVHVNRSLRSLRAENMISLRRRRLMILDPQRLHAVSGFGLQYLHAQNRDDIAFKKLKRSKVSIDDQQDLRGNSELCS